MSIAAVVTRGFGSFGSANEVVTRGYSIGEVVIPAVWTNVTAASGTWTNADAADGTWTDVDPASGTWTAA